VNAARRRPQDAPARAVYGLVQWLIDAQRHLRAQSSGPRSSATFSAWSRQNWLDGHGPRGAVGQVQP
jgi:hypothetical protein